MMAKRRSVPARSLLETLESRVLLSASPAIAHVLGGPIAHETYQVGGKITTTSSTTTLAAPTNVTATATSSTTVSLSWTVSINASGYYVYRSTAGGKYTQIAKLGLATSYTDSTVAASTSYSYYLVAYKSRTLSGSSNVASVTTLAAPIVALPAAPTNLAVTTVTTNGLSLTWTDNATNESGERVYRSADGVNYTQVASLGAGTTTYTDAGLASGTQYYYEVSAWNSAGEVMSAATSGTTTAVVPTGNPISITTRYGNELVLAGTSGNDSIYVSQSGSTLTITANGYTTTAAVPANGLFIYSNGGSDTITVDSSVTARLTIATIDGAPTTISNGDANANVWMDSTDGFSGVGVTHKVASFYENVSKAIGAAIPEPTDSGTMVAASGSLWGSGPVMGDVNQGELGDCYFVSSLAAFANSMPSSLQNMAVDLGDGTYAVQYMRGGTPTFVRVDALMPSGPFEGFANAHPGATGDIWAMIMEKSYAYFRSGSNTWSSLNSGWMGNVYSDFGIANTTLSLGSDSSLYSTVSADLAAGKPVTFATFSSGTTLVSDHAYSLVSVSNIGGVNYYTVRNPWGVSGDSLEDSGGYATLTFAQMAANFQAGCAAV